MKQLNAEEYLIGSFFSLVFIPVIGMWAVLLAPLQGLLWSLSGAGYSKLFRRLLVPAIPIVVIVIQTGYLGIIFSLPLAFGVLSLGYGIQDSTDKGSWLGRFWYEKYPEHANFLTRFTIYFLLAVSYYIPLYPILPEVLK